MILVIIIGNYSDNDDIVHHDEKSNNMTNDVNLVHESMILNNCKDNWPTILNKLSDPLKGAKVIQIVLHLKHI